MEAIGTNCFITVNSSKLRFKFVDKATYFGKSELDQVDRNKSNNGYILVDIKKFFNKNMELVKTSN